MDYQEAEKIVNGYVAAVDRERQAGDLVRYESWLPCSKDRIINAYKIFLAYVMKFKTLTTDEFKRHFMILNYIDSFIEDTEATLINHYWKLGNAAKQEVHKKEPKIAEICMNYLDNIFVCNKLAEVVSFVQEVQKLDCNHPFYCRRIYELANIKYMPIYENSFSEKNNYTDTVSDFV